MIAIPIFTMNTQQNIASPLTNAMLPEIKDLVFPLEAADCAKLDAYINGRIGLHDEALTAYQLVHAGLFGELAHPSYQFGINSYVFPRLKNDIPDATFIDVFCAYLGRVQEYCEARDVPFLYCINPTKTTVYTSDLPNGYLYSDVFYTMITQKLEQYGVNYIDNRDLLVKAAESEQVYNRQYDAGHWNDLGEFYATNNMLKAVSRFFPAVREHTLDDFLISEKTEEYLPLSYFPVNETVPVFTLADTESVSDITSLYSAVKLDPNFQGFMVYHLDTSSEQLPRVLFFHGSYYNRNRDFYKSSFAETYAVHNYGNLLNFEYYFNIFKPDCVILETAEYATTARYFDPDDMSKKEFNPILDLNSGSEYSEFTPKELNAEYTIADNLETITVLVDPDALYGYMTAGGEVFDLILDEETAYCTVDRTQTDLTDIKLIFFYE